MLRHIRVWFVALSTADHDNFRNKIENILNTTDSASNVIKAELSIKEIHICVVVSRIICCKVFGTVSDIVLTGNRCGRLCNVVAECVS